MRGIGQHLELRQEAHVRERNRAVNDHLEREVRNHAGVAELQTLDEHRSAATIGWRVGDRGVVGGVWHLAIGAAVDRDAIPRRLVLAVDEAVCVAVGKRCPDQFAVRPDARHAKNLTVH